MTHEVMRINSSAESRLITVKQKISASTFIDEDFLLQTPSARRLYHDYARRMPIVDYHCHLPPEQIARDHRFENLTQLWLYGDHYKWRAMRTNGVDERYCTGDASDWEKFLKWAETVPATLCNPLYHWTHLELKRYFNVDDCLLSPETARAIWDHCNEKLAQADFSCRGLLKRMNVKLVCTTDDPCDSLEAHRTIQEDSDFGVQVRPTFRPDAGMAVDCPATFNAWVDRLSVVADVDIRDFSSYLEALRRRHSFFHQMGCRLSDHGIETAFTAEYTEREVQSIFLKIRQGIALGRDEVAKFKSAMLFEFGLLDHEKGWAQQYHLGALRNANSRMSRLLGPDSGFDSIGDFEIAVPLAGLLDRLDRQGRLAKTILYNINPRDNELIASMAGNFQDGSVAGKIQFGSAWWFLDHKDGIERQLKALANIGLLSRFVGMLTDSRSFLSYARHEYFRRVLCNWLEDEIEKGILPRDFELIGGLVQDICFRNALEYFGFEC